MPQSLQLSLPVLVHRQASGSYSVALFDEPAIRARVGHPDEAGSALSHNWRQRLALEKDPVSILHRLEQLARRKTLAIETVAVPAGQAPSSVWVHSFRLGKEAYASFPGLGGKVRVAPPSGLEKTARDLTARMHRLGQKWTPAEEGDFVKQATLTLQVRSTPHGWEHRLPKDQPVQKTPQWEQGKRDVKQLGTRLNDHYPDRLRRAWGRQDLVGKLVDLIREDRHPAIVLLGETGSGRHSLVHELVHRFLADEYESGAPDFWLVNPNRIISGMSVIGQWQRRMEAILTYLAEPADQSQPDILVLDQVLPLISLGSGRRGHFALADVLAEWLRAHRSKVILIASPREWGILQGKNRAFADLFVHFPIPSLSHRQSLPLVVRKKRELERQHKVVFSIQAMQELMTLYDRHLRPKALPGAVGELMDRLVEYFPAATVRAAEVRQWFMDQFGVPESYPAAGREASLEDFLSTRLIGQPEAVGVLSRVIALIQTRLQPPGKPISTLLFVGPTGVGKTQAAKTLSLALYGDDHHLLRFDMNEYGDPAAVSRLIGWHAGSEGLLTAKVNRQPFGVLLLDEIEKAHPSVHNLLLQVLDEGRLTDSRGQTTHFNNLVIVMTSNLGVRESQSQLGYQKGESPSSLFRRAVEQFFRPELVNRIDDLVVFQSLRPEHILPITRLQINELLKRDGLIRRTSLLHLSLEALEWLAQKGYDAQMGGRALKRTIEKELTVLTADQLLRIPPQQPLIIDILLKDGRLHPQLHPLVFRPLGDGLYWKHLEKEVRHRRILSDLRQQTEYLIRETNRFAGEEDASSTLIGDAAGRDQWAVFHHKERLAQLQESLLHFQAGYRQHAPTALLRFKQASRFEDGQLSPLDPGHALHLLDPQELDNIRQAHPLAPALCQSEYSQILILLQKVNLAHRMQEALQGNRRPEKCQLRIRRRSGPPKPELLQLLRRQYEQLFEWLDLNYRWSSERSCFDLEGFGLEELLQRETGYNLFVIPHQNPILFELVFRRQDAPAPKVRKLPINRLYFADQLVLDLDRACTCVLPLRPEESLFLL